MFISRRPQETADGPHSPLKVVLEDLIEAKVVLAPPPLRSFICSRGLPPTSGLDTGRHSSGCTFGKKMLFLGCGKSGERMSESKNPHLKAASDTSGYLAIYPPCLGCVVWI